jgi:hypothetical protein
MSSPKFTDETQKAKSVVAALTGHVARYTVAVVPETGPYLATGVLVSSGDALYIATARHVAEALVLDKVFVIPRSDVPLKIVKEEEIDSTSARGPSNRSFSSFD